MEQLFQHGLSNAAAAALLAILAAIATRLWRNPHFAYAAWLIVLVRLVAPPLVPVNVPLPAASTLADYSRAVGLGPRMDAAPAGNRADQPADSQTKRGIPVVSSTNVSRPIVGLSPLDGESEKSPAVWQRLNKGGSQPDVRTLASIMRRQESNLTEIDPPEVAADTKLARVTTRTPPSDGLSRVANMVSTLPSQLRRLPITQWLIAIWLSGTCGYLLLVCVRAVRFSRALRAGRLELSESLRAEADAAAATVGLRRRPRMAMLAAPLPPFVWPGWRPTVLLPQALVESLGVSQRRLLLLHEFVHLRRLDHRVRWFQIGVVALFWWNPIAWWAARRLERAEEECCDAAVVRLQPDQAEGYGQTLVAVTEFLSTGKLPAPALSIGIVRKNHLRRRLTMILSGPRWPGLSKTRFAVLASVGAALVALTWRGVTAQNVPSSDPVVDRWFETGTKTALEPTVVAPSRADTRLAALLKLEPLQPDAGDHERQKLLKERYNAALSEVLANQQQSQLGAAPSVDRLCRSARDLFEAELALVTRTRDKVRILERYVDYCNKTWAEVNARMNSGLLGGGSADEARARAARLEAEIRLNEFHAATEAAAPEAANAATASAPADGQRLATLLKLEPVQPEPGDDELQKLLKERYNAAVRAVKLNQYQYELGTARAGLLCAATRELIEAELALVGSRAEKIRILEEYVNQCTRLWKQAQSKLEIGGVTGFSPVDEAESRAARYEAEIKLLRLRDESKERPPERIAAPVASAGAPEKPAGQTQTATETVAEPPEIVFLQKPARTDKSLPALLYPKRLDAAAGDDELRKLLKERYNAAQRTMEVYTNRILVSGFFPAFGDFLAAGRNLRDALLALSEKPQTQLHVLETYLEFTRYLEKIADAKLLAGGMDGEIPVDAARMREARADAELKLLELRQRAGAHGQSTKPTAGQSALSPNADAAGTASSATSARPDGAESFAGPAPDVHNASGPLNPNGKSLVDLVKFDDQKPQPGESAQRKQLMERYNDALHSVKSKLNRFEQGKTSAELLCNAAREFTDARLAMFDDPVERAPIANWYTVFALRTWRDAEAKLHAGGNTRENRDDEAAAREAIFDARAEYAAVIKVLPALMRSKLAEISPSDDKRQQLLIEQFNSALRHFGAAYSRCRVGSTSFAAVIAAARELHRADVARSRADDAARAHERGLELLRYLENQAESIRKNGGPIGPDAVEAAHAARLEAELELLDAQRAAGNQKPPSGAESKAVAPAATRQLVAPGTRSNALPVLLTAEPLKPAAGDDERTKLLKERYNAAIKSLKAVYNRRRFDPSTSWLSVLAAARPILPAELALTKPQDAKAVYARYFELMKSLDEQVEDQFKARAFTSRDELEAAHEARLDAEIKLLDARQSAVGQQWQPAPAAIEAPRSTATPVSPSPPSQQSPTSHPKSEARPAWLTAEPLKVEASDDDHKKLLKERYNAALQSLKAVDDGRKIDPAVTANDVIAAARQLLAADVALHKSGNVVPSYERYFEFMKFLENIVTPERRAGPATYEAVHEARLDAEVKLLDVKGGTAPGPVRARASGTK